MLATVLKRLGQGLLSLLVVIVLVFGLVRLTGDPARSLLPAEAGPEDFERVTRDLGLDRPIYEQFFNYLGGVLTGDLGTSYRLDRPVMELVAERFPHTLLLAGSALALTLLVAIPLAVLSARRRNGPIDRFGQALAAIGQGTPSFWVGLLLILAFAVQLQILPSGGYGEPRHLILPVVTLALEPIARLTRLLRSSLLEELSSDYVTFLRMKGLKERKVLWKHVLRNGSLTALTYFGILSVGLLSGSVLVEVVFVWPGIGRLVDEAIHYRDYAVIQGLTLLISAAYIVGNLVVDLLYTVANPRLRTT